MDTAKSAGNCLIHLTVKDVTFAHRPMTRKQGNPKPYNAADARHFNFFHKFGRRGAPLMVGIGDASKFLQ